jgi:hypothetical protein
MMASRTLALAIGLGLAACGPQPQSVAAVNETTETPVTAPAQPANATAPAPAAEASPAAAQDYTIDRTHKGVGELLGNILRRVGTLDGARITGFTLRDRCTTVIATAAGSATIDWTKVADWASRDIDGERVTPIDDGSGAHRVGVPAEPQPEPIGDAGALVESGFSSLADGCQS